MVLENNTKSLRAGCSRAWYLCASAQHTHTHRHAHPLCSALHYIAHIQAKVLGVRWPQTIKARLSRLFWCPPKWTGRVVVRTGLRPRRRGKSRVYTPSTVRSYMRSFRITNIGLFYFTNMSIEFLTTTKENIYNYLKHFRCRRLEQIRFRRPKKFIIYKFIFNCQCKIE